METGQTEDQKRRRYLYASIGIIIGSIAAIITSFEFIYKTRLELRDTEIIQLKKQVSILETRTKQLIRDSVYQADYRAEMMLSDTTKVSPKELSKITELKVTITEQKDTIQYLRGNLSRLQNTLSNEKQRGSNNFVAFEKYRKESGLLKFSEGFEDATSGFSIGLNRMTFFWGKSEDVSALITISGAKTKEELVNVGSSWTGDLNGRKYKLVITGLALDTEQYSVIIQEL